MWRCHLSSCSPLHGRSGSYPEYLECLDLPPAASNGGPKTSTRQLWRMVLASCLQCQGTGGCRSHVQVASLQAGYTTLMRSIQIFSFNLPSFFLSFLPLILSFNLFSWKSLCPFPLLPSWFVSFYHMRSSITPSLSHSIFISSLSARDFEHCFISVIFLERRRVADKRTETNNLVTDGGEGAAIVFL